MSSELGTTTSGLVWQHNGFAYRMLSSGDVERGGAGDGFVAWGGFIVRPEEALRALCKCLEEKLREDVHDE